MGGGGGAGYFPGTAGARGSISSGTDPFSGGILVAAAVPDTMSDAGGVPQPVRDAARLLERPLDIGLMGKVLQWLGLPHKQFFYENGENFGKMADGQIRADAVELLRRYSQTDHRLFKAKYIREAQQELVAFGAQSS